MMRALHIFSALSKAGLHAVRGEEKEAMVDAVRSIASLRGAFVKFIQSAALFPELLPQQWADVGDVVFEQVPPMGVRMVDSAMERSYGGQWENMFFSFEHKARFAASFGQVHYAQLSNDQQPCAVKVQYPEAEKWLKKDLALLESFVHYRYKGAFDVVAIMRDISMQLYEELDYIKESSSMTFFQSIAHAYPLLHIPQALSEYSCEKVLCMEWVEGIGMDQLLKEATQKHKDNIGQTLFSFWMESLLVHGCMHGDPHFGNYKFLNDGRVALLDFGSTISVSQNFLEGLRLLYEALKEKKQQSAYEALEIMGFQAQQKDVYTSVFTWAEFLFKPLLSPDVTTIYQGGDTEKGRHIFRNILKNLRHHSVIIPKDFVWFDRVVMSLAAVMFALGAVVPWQEIFESFLYAAKNKKSLLKNAI